MSSNVSNKDQLNEKEVDLEIDSIRHIEVLKMKINVDEKSHQNEKDEIRKESGATIKSLQDENNSLTIKTRDQADKVRQLENANTKKERNRKNEKYKR